MDDYDRTIAVYLGALLFDGIIPADLEVIEKTIHSLKRAATLRRKERTSRAAEVAADIQQAEMHVRSVLERAQPKDPVRIINPKSARETIDKPETPNDAS